MADDSRIDASDRRDVAMMRSVCGDRAWRATTGSFDWLPRGIPHGHGVDGEVALAIAQTAGLDRFDIEAGRPAKERAMPPRAPPDIAKLDAAGSK